MGAVVQTKEQSKINTIIHIQSSHRQKLTFGDFEVTRMGHGGHSIVRYGETKEGLFVNKRIPETIYQSQKEKLQRWVNTNSKNSCNVVEYTIKNESFFCSSHVDIKAVIEYSDCNLSTLLATNRAEWQVDQFQCSRRQSNMSNPLQILNLIKFCIETAEEHHQNTTMWPIFHTTNVLYFKKQKQLKFLYIPQMEQAQQNEIFFDPQSQQLPIKQSQQTTVFSIGMIVLSFLIKEDCSECYDYQRFQFCQSVFEDKIQKMLSLLSKNQILGSLSYSRVGNTLEQQLIEFASFATSPLVKRPNLSQLKRKYFKLLRQISLGCQSSRCVSTKRVYQRQRSFLKSKRAREELNAFQTRQPINDKKKSSNTEDTLQLVGSLSKHKRITNKKNCRIKICEDENKQNMGVQQYG